MKQVMRKTANYAADLAGINSALYELGGLIIMHDASGCNSTYATHDEPRWAKMHSLIFISALEEYDAILGNDDKLIEEVIEAANETQPNFIALFGSPIALAIGTDFKGMPIILNRKPSFLVSAFQLRAWQVIVWKQSSLLGFCETFLSAGAKRTYWNWYRSTGLYATRFWLLWQCRSIGGLV